MCDVLRTGAGQPFVKVTNAGCYVSEKYARYYLLIAKCGPLVHPNANRGCHLILMDDLQTMDEAEIEQGLKDEKISPVEFTCGLDEFNFSSCEFGFLAPDQIIMKPIVRNLCNAFMHLTADVEFDFDILNEPF